MKIVYSILICVLISSCERDCTRTINGIKGVFGITKYKTPNYAFDNWYKTDTFNNELQLYVDLQTFGAGEYCKYYMSNRLIDDSISIFSNRKIVVNNDSLKEFSNITQHFNINKDVHETYLDVGYFINLNKLNKTYFFESGEYKFYFKGITTNGLYFLDSCSINRN